MDEYIAKRNSYLENGTPVEINSSIKGTKKVSPAIVGVTLLTTAVIVGAGYLYFKGKKVKA